MTSILTNNGAMVALQTLKGINKNMGEVQNQISTGLKVSTAKDDSSSWAIASTMKSDIKAYGRMNDALTSSSAMVGVARAASEQMVEILKNVQDKLVQSYEPGADLAKLQADITGALENITSIAGSAQYNGINLVNNTDTENVVLSMNRTGTGTGTVTLEEYAVVGHDLATTVGGITLTVDGDATSDADLDTVEVALQAAITAAAAFGAAQNRVESQADFLSKQSDAIKDGVGALVDADMEEVSARLQALQVQQQLGTQALSIANQAPQSVLSLFR